MIQNNSRPPRLACGQGRQRLNRRGRSEDVLDRRLAGEDANARCCALAHRNIAQGQLQRLQPRLDRLEFGAGRPRPGRAHPALEAGFGVVVLGAAPKKAAMASKSSGRSGYCRRAAPWPRRTGFAGFPPAEPAPAPENRLAARPWEITLSPSRNLSRRIIVTLSPAMSRGPTSSRIGAPRRSQSQRLLAERIGFLSRCARRGWPKAASCRVRASSFSQ